MREKKNLVRKVDEATVESVDRRPRRRTHVFSRDAEQVFRAKAAQYLATRQGGGAREENQLGRIACRINCLAWMDFFHRDVHCSRNFRQRVSRRRSGSQHKVTSKLRRVSRFFGVALNGHRPMAGRRVSRPRRVRRPRLSHIVRGMTRVVLCRINQLTCLPGLCYVEVRLPRTYTQPDYNQASRRCAQEILAQPKINTPDLKLSVKNTPLCWDCGW